MGDSDDGRRVEKSVAAYRTSELKWTRRDFVSFLDAFYTAVDEACTVTNLRHERMDMDKVGTAVYDWKTNTRRSFDRFFKTYIHLGDNPASPHHIRSLAQRVKSALAILSRQLREVADDSYVGQEEVLEFLSSALSDRFATDPMLSWLQIRFSPAKVDIGGSFSDLCAIPDGPRPPTR
jgi:hypothetical protein